MFLKGDNVGAKRMSSGRQFQATGPATQKGVRFVTETLQVGSRRRHPGQCIVGEDHSVAQEWPLLMAECHRLAGE